jgi:glycosidase/fibronectin type 3 domain-containing protein
VKKRELAVYALSVLSILALVLAGMPVVAVSQAQGDGILIDGAKEAAWGAPLASDPAGDMTEPNLDLQTLYVVEDADNFYIGFDATASNWGMTYGIYIDTDQVAGSGATSDPWGRAVNAVPAHLPEHTLFVWHEDWDALQEVQLGHWDGVGWSSSSLVSQGGEQAYGPADDWIEYRVPKAALGSPASIALEVFTTGGDGHAQDTVPSDPNVAYTDPDWGPDVTTLSAFALFPPPPPPEWYARSDFNGWDTTDPMYDDGTNGDAVAGDGIFSAQVTTATAGRHEFKIATEDWSASFPGSGNSWLETTTADETVTITFDTNTHADGWLPETNIIGVSIEPGTWTAVGDWQGWDNANPATAMTALGGGVYGLITSIASPGTYQYKAVKTGTWDAVGADERGVNASTATFETTVADQNVTFAVEALGGRVSVEVAEVPSVPGHDDDIWWDGLGHNSRDDLYRVPGGAVTTDTPVTLRFRTFRDDVTGVTVRVWSTAAGAQALYPMELVATTDDEPYGYDWWQATLPAQDELTILYYRFIVRDGSDENFYEDDDLFDGGWGTTYEDSPDYSFQIDVYLPDFETPDWMKNAVVYQIFPDRFYNGQVGNDPKPKDPSVYDNPVLVQSWDDLPEGYCRAYEDVACEEGPLGRDFFGGDLKGVREKLDYLKDLGVTAIYFNPIFRAPSNHLYDTTDYYQIDPYFGPYGQYQSLVKHAERLGIHLILDGVFNHTSSDSLYFDRYSRYKTVGAYESQDSEFYDWYTFSDWPGSYNSWWGFDSLPVLTEIQEVRDFIFGDEGSVARTWIEDGASGWRLDVAPDKSHEFWASFRPSVKSADPEAIITGEIWDDASEWILGDELDTTMNYRFRRALLGFVNGDTNDPNQGFVRGLNPDQFNSVLQSIKEDYPPPAYQTAMNLVGSHDTQRILWALTPGARNREEKESNPANLEEGVAKLKLLAILQMTMPGAPTIYYGDEVGLTGDTDPDDRRPFPWNGMNTDLLGHYQTLTGLRNDYSFLRTGSFDRLYTHNDAGTYAYGRKDASGAAVVAVNRDTAAHDLTIPVSGYIPEGTVLSDALNGGTYPVSGSQVTITVAGRWGAILVTPPGTDLTPPQPPAGLTAAEGDDRVDLAWNGVPGAAGYYVYRSPVSGGGYARLNDAPLAATTYADETVVNGRLYYYVVTAVDEAGNESGWSNEAEALPHLVIGWANLQWPPTIAHTISALNPTENIYGQVWIDGHTNLGGPTEGLLAQVGYGPVGSHPEGNPDWTWVDAVFNVDAGNNDEFRGQLLPEAVGTYDYAYRYSTTGGLEWLYADLDGTGNGYDPAQAGSLTVNPSGDTTPPAAPANLHLVEASPSFVRLAWDAIPDADLYRYEVYRRDMEGDPYEIANVLGPVTDYTDWNVATGSTYYYVVLAADTSFNRSGDSNEVEATAQARPVQVTFNATLPDTTPEGEEIYIGGSFNSWDPAGTLMVRTDPAGLLATVTLTFYEGDHLEYKYTRGSWDYVEKGAACEEINNRVVTVVYGGDGKMTLNDTVLNWRNTGPCED